MTEKPTDKEILAAYKEYLQEQRAKYTKFTLEEMLALTPEQMNEMDKSENPNDILGLFYYMSEYIHTEVITKNVTGYEQLAAKRYFDTLVKKLGDKTIPISELCKEIQDCIKLSKGEIPKGATVPEVTKAVYDTSQLTDMFFYQWHSRRNGQPLKEGFSSPVSYSDKNAHKQQVQDFCITASPENGETVQATDRRVYNAIVSIYEEMKRQGKPFLNEFISLRRITKEVEHTQNPTEEQMQNTEKSIDRQARTRAAVSFNAAIYEGKVSTTAVEDSYLNASKYKNCMIQGQLVGTCYVFYSVPFAYKYAEIEGYIERVDNKLLQTPLVDVATGKTAKSRKSLLIPMIKDNLHIRIHQMKGQQKSNKGAYNPKIDIERFLTERCEINPLNRKNKSYYLNSVIIPYLNLLADAGEITAHSIETQGRTNKNIVITLPKLPAGQRKGSGRGKSKD